MLDESRTQARVFTLEPEQGATTEENTVSVAGAAFAPALAENHLVLVSDEHGEFRVRVITRPELDVVKPNAPTELAVTDVGARRVSLSFVAPGDDAVAGTVRGYEIRYRVGSPVTEQNFDAADTIVEPSSITPAQAGTLH